MQIEGLQQSSANQPARKVVYGNRKKKTTADRAESEHTTREQSPVPETHPPPKGAADNTTLDAEPTGDLKDNWEASSDEEKTVLIDQVKGSWDDSESEGESVASQALRTGPFRTRFIVLTLSLKQMLANRRPSPNLHKLPRLLLKPRFKRMLKIQKTIIRPMIPLLMTPRRSPMA